jgi:hypothetical protein
MQCMFKTISLHLPRTILVGVAILSPWYCNNLIKNLPEYALKKKVRWSMNSKQGSRYIKRRMGNDLKNQILVHDGIITEESAVAERKPSVLSCSLRISQHSLSAIHRPLPSVHDQRNGGLSQEIMAKIEELKRLMNKYTQYHTNQDDIIRLAIFNSINGDDTLLDGKLEQLRSIESLA